MGECVERVITLLSIHCISLYLGFLAVVINN